MFIGPPARFGDTVQVGTSPGFGMITERSPLDIASARATLSSLALEQSDDGHVFDERLSDQKTIERISMVKHEAFHAGYMSELDAEQLEAVGRELFWNKLSTGVATVSLPRLTLVAISQQLAKLRKHPANVAYHHAVGAGDSRRGGPSFGDGVCVLRTRLH